MFEEEAIFFFSIYLFCAQICLLTLIELKKNQHIVSRHIVKLPIPQCFSVCKTVLHYFSKKKLRIWNSQKKKKKIKYLKQPQNK